VPAGSFLTISHPTTEVAEVLPLLYLHGLSTGDFVPALEGFLVRPPGCPQPALPG
jgi:hypothetical protein